MFVRVWLILALAATPACSGDNDGPPPRELAFGAVAFDSAGVSDEVVFEVPEGTRSMTVVATGDLGALYAMASLRTSDGVEHVSLPADIATTLEDSYFVEQSGGFSGLFQSIRLGIFVHIHPNTPSLSVPPGDMSVRIATNDPSIPVDILILLDEDDGASVLHVNVFAVSNDFSYTADDPASVPFVGGARALLGAGGVTLAVDRVINLRDSGLSMLTEFNEPQEPPTSMSSELALLGAGVVDNDALNIFVVDRMPFGVGGWSLGTPGPPLVGTRYSGVMVTNDATTEQVGRTVAHEVAHFLGLAHVQNRGVSGAIYPDPLDDTMPMTGNLMEGGTVVTDDQAFVLGRNPLLRLE